MGDSYVYADSPLPEWALLGQYGNGAAKSAGRLEYIWLPTEDGNAIPVGLYRNGKLYAVHSDHLGTPRLITNEDKRPVWQWPYSAFGANAPTGILKATKSAKQAYTTQPVLLKATQAPLEYNLRYPGQYYDEESQLSYNYQRSYQAAQGRYTQSDPIGLNGGWNQYAYVGGSPLGYADPVGLQAQAIGAALPPLIVGCAVSQGCLPAVVDSCGNIVRNIQNWVFSDGADNSNDTKPSLSDHKDALDKVHGEVGKLPKGEKGKFGSPQAGDSKKGYRLDPPHDGVAQGDAESKYHFNWWDYSGGKRGRGGRSGAIPIGD